MTRIVEILSDSAPMTLPLDTSPFDGARGAAAGYANRTALSVYGRITG